MLIAFCIVAALLALGVTMALRRLISKPDIPKAKVGQRNIPPDTEEFRIAVHEAGHAITAWWCTTVVRVNHVTIADASGGHLDMNIKNNTLGAIWCNLVITLAGLAAEVTIYRNGRSGPAATDLLKARQLVNVLIQNGSTSPPWDIKHSSTLNFEKMFQAPLSETEKKILDAGYQHARYLLEQYFKDHHRLVVHLLQHRTVSGMEMETLFGNRNSTTMFGLFRATFVGAP